MAKPHIVVHCTRRKTEMEMAKPHIVVHCTRRKTEEDYEILLSDEHILDLLRLTGKTIPADAKVEFHIPASGDYRCGEELPINNESRILVSWKETKVE